MILRYRHNSEILLLIDIYVSRLLCCSRLKRDGDLSHAKSRIIVSKM
jgi:hypothetical protein